MPSPVAFLPFALVLFAVSVFGPCPAAAQDEQHGSFSLLVENDLFAGTDQHYTNGVKGSWLSPEGDLPGFGRWLARNMPLLAPAGKKRISYAVGQNIYTPDDISATALVPDERPYAGWLYGEVGLVSETEATLDSLALSVGVIGPLSLAEETQDFWHETFGFDEPKGWDHQLENEPALNLFAERKWRSLWHRTWLFGLDTDVTPHLGLALGNVFTHAAAGVMLRLGEGLESDFGPPRIRPSMPGSGHFTPGPEIGWYVFGGIEGRAVARNIFLDGNTFTDSHSVDKKSLVGDAQFGVALVLPRVRIAYTQVLRTKEFDGQDRADIFGAISVTARF